MLQMGDSWGVEVETHDDDDDDGVTHTPPKSLLREDTGVFSLPHHFRGKEKLENTDPRDSWVVEVEKFFESETRPVKFHDGVIQTVPKSLLRGKESEVFYHPQVISLGPYHFKKKEKLDDEIELLKSEVARKVHHEIIGDFKFSDMVGGHSLFEIGEEKKKESYAESGNGLKSVTERFKKKEKRIKKTYGQSGSGLKWALESFQKKEKRIEGSYARHFEFTAEVCAWMITRDACFVLEVLERFRKDEGEEKSVSASIDGILSRKRHHPLLTEIVKDMLKMENQLPFWALKEIRPDIEDWFESALKNLSPIEVADIEKNREYKGKYHILQLLHDYIVDRPIPVVVLPHTPDIPSGKGGRFIFIVYGIILLVSSPFLFIVLIILVIQECVSPKWKIREHAATVEELNRAGVKFKKLEGKCLGISHIKFKESNSTLYLPKFKVDNRSEVILRNLIALEICSEEKEQPITRYVIMMNDLINTSEDVGILRRAEIITSKLGSDEEIAQFWNSMATSTEVPSYDPIDKVLLSIDRYRKKWWKVLWAQFAMTHCSKPWLFLSLLAGLSLLLLTIAQVVCLFASCEIK